jgi:4-hydroxybenzoate polyprenyltransferase
VSRGVIKIAKTVFAEFVYGGHLLSLGAAGIVAVVQILLGLQIDYAIVLIAYFLSQVIYAVNHYTEIKDDMISNPERTKHINQSFVVFAIGAYVIGLMSLLLLFSNILTVLIVLAMLISGLVYPKPLTKYIVGFKNIFVSTIWAMLVVIVVSHTGSDFSYSTIVIFIYIFLRFMLSTVFFDIKDLEVDRARGLKTFPVVLGEKKTVIALNMLNILSTVFLIGFVLIGLFPIFTLAIGLFFIYDHIYINYYQRMSKKGLRLLSYIYVDGEYALWPIIVILANVIQIAYAA